MDTQTELEPEIVDTCKYCSAPWWYGFKGHLTQAIFWCDHRKYCSLERRLGAR